ncbi:MAG: S-methyl-5-thioribose-1-phosphate isomerase [Spongiibacteraceae bacterium]
MYAPIEPIRWRGDHLELLDQRLLPAEEVYIALRDVETIAAAIRDMVVRGAPAIGITAAYGVAIAAKNLAAAQNISNWANALEPSLQLLAASRPTAINLFWAIDRCREVINHSQNIVADIETLALQIHRDDIANNRRIGQFGAELIEPDSVVYTHCNAGALATGGYGTALGVIRSAFSAGKIAHVYAGETRPWWQGSRLTSWELLRDGIPCSLCVEGAASWIVQNRHVKWIIVGADRIAANGDVANKIGTHNLAIIARHCGAKFMVAAPHSTFDLTLANGNVIPIEQRHLQEITHIRDTELATPGCHAVNPAFDVTPAALIDAIVTEHGVIHHPTTERIARHFAEAIAHRAKFT